MPAPLTVIIPTLNAAKRLGPPLASLYEGVQSGLIAELVFADGGSTDETPQIAEDVGATLITSTPGRGTQLAKAAIVVKTPWLMVIHSDTTLSPEWPMAVRHHMQSSQNAAHFRLAFDSPSLAAKRTAAWANLRSKFASLPYGDQGLLIPMSLYNTVGGYAEVPLMEDVALVRKLRGRLTELSVTATTSAAKYEAEGYLKRGCKNLITLAKYFLGVPPETLAKRY
jgi:rSAM/selenodomain-associated transferase 2